MLRWATIPAVADTLSIPQAIIVEIKQHAVSAYPQECCGILLGRVDEQARRLVTEVIRCRNVHGSPQSHYNIDPEALIAVQCLARDHSVEIIGFYHSHPDHPAQASAADQDQAYWAACSYLILSTSVTTVLEMNSFYCPAQQKLVPEQLDIIS